MGAQSRLFPTVRISFSTDGATFTPIGQPITLSYVFWMGARAGFFSSGTEGGSVDLDYFRYQLTDGIVAAAPKP